MAAPQSNADIANMACDHLGMPPITSIDAPTTNTEKVLARHYDDVRRNVLRDSNYGFAKGRATIARNPTAPPFDYTDRYAMPGDFLRLLTVNLFNVQNTVPQLWWNNYDFAEGFLLINAGGATSMEIRYVQDIVDVTKWDANMAEIVSLRLAKRVCITLTNDRNKLADLNSLLKEAKQESLATNGQENKPRRVQYSKALQARMGANSFGRTIWGGTYVDFGPW